MRLYLVLLALFSISFSSLLWQTSTNGAITTQPVVYENRIIVGSSDGNIYALNPGTGSISWKTMIGGTPTDTVQTGGSLIIATDDGKMVKLGKNGEKLWETELSKKKNASTIFGLNSRGNSIYVSTNTGVYSINKDDQTIKDIYLSKGTITQVAVGDSYLIFGIDNRLIKIRDNGVIEWTQPLQDGKFWVSSPVISEGTIYIGSLDNKMHAYQVQGGHERWEFATRNWVLGTPYIENGIIYFGSNDGYVYSLSTASGEMIWKSKTQLAVQGELVSGFMGGQDVVFAGSTDKNMYAMKKDNGEIVWKGSATDWVTSPLFYNNMIVFGSYDRGVYSFSTERACSITNPKEGAVVGKKELQVIGKYVSESGAAKVYVNINNGIWKEADADNDGWEYVLDPSKELNEGLNTISCKVVDSAGEETGSKLTTVGITFDSKIKLSNLVVTVSPIIVQNEPFTVYVNDGDDGSPVKGFNMTVDGKPYNGDEKINLTMGAGSYQIRVSKTGFNDYGSTLEVRSTGVNPIFIGIGVLLIVIIIWQVWLRVISKKFMKK